jgi:hypothetical protein
MGKMTKKETVLKDNKLYSVHRYPGIIAVLLITIELYLLSVVIQNYVGLIRIVLGSILIITIIITLILEFGKKTYKITIPIGGRGRK